MAEQKLLESRPPLPPVFGASDVNERILDRVMVVDGTGSRFIWPIIGRFTDKQEALSEGNMAHEGYAWMHTSRCRNM